MEDFLKQTLEHLIGRIEGPFWVRLVLQPLTASILGIRAAVRDARAGRPPFGWLVLRDKEHRRELLREAWREVAKVFILAIVIDVIYQIVVFHWTYPGQALLVSTVLSLVPYPVFRGVANRVIRLLQARRAKDQIPPVAKKAS